MNNISNRTELIDYILRAHSLRAEYIVVGIDLGMPSIEYIVNSVMNAVEKAEYYERAYNEDLTLKANPNIRIVGISYGGSQTVLGDLLSF